MLTPREKADGWENCWQSELDEYDKWKTNPTIYQVDDEPMTLDPEVEKTPPQPAPPPKI